MAKKNKHQEEHPSEAWLVPYADILTLLLALFIVLFASSKVDEKKLEQMAESFKAAFDSNSGILKSGSSPIPLVSPTPPQPPQTRSKNNDSAKAEDMQLASLQDKINRFIQQNNLKGQLGTIITNEGLIIETNASLLFKSGDADLTQGGMRIADMLTDMLSTVEQNVIIAGHTDDEQIHTPEFPSNWDLSSKRAINVMKYILKQNKNLLPERFSAIGYGEYRPIVPNITPNNRAKNRRVEILIVRNFPE